MIGQLLDRRYRITEVIGTAEFGLTYLAKDTHRPGQPECFVKHLKPATNDLKMLETARRLFDKEAEMLEKLGQHDQIPQLFAYFEENKEFFLVEEFIPGHPLSDEILPGQPLSENQVTQLLREVLEILVFVHGHGVIHRDIKPSNLIRRFSDKKLILIDFGSVKEIGTQFASGQMPPTMRVGTLEYMPVEQFQYNPQLNSDIYALGMIGIQCLTGLPIYELPKLRDTKNFNNGEIFWRHLAIVSQDFADILDKMVRHDYRQRYQTTTEVLAALIKISDRSGIRVPKLTIYREEVERRVSSRGEISVVGRSILDALRNSLELQTEEADAIEEEVLEPYKNYREKLQQYERAFTEAIKDEKTLSQQTREELTRLQQVLELDEEDIKKIESKIPVVPSTFTVDWKIPNFKLPEQFKYIVAACIPLFVFMYGLLKAQESFGGHQSDSKQITAINQLVSAGNYEGCLAEISKLGKKAKNDKIKQLQQQCQAGVNWKNPQVKTLIGHSDAVGAVAFSPDGKVLASGSKDKSIKLWDVATGNISFSIKGDDSAVWSVAFSPDGNRLATGSFFWRVLLWNPKTGDLFRTVEHDAAVWSVAFSGKNNTLVSGGEDRKVKVWSLETSKPIYSFPDNSDYVYSVAISQDGKTVVSGSRDGKIKIWDAINGNLIHSIDAHSAEVRSVAITADGKMVVSGSYDKTIKIWKAETGELIRTLQGHSGDIVSVAISPDGKTIASGSKDKTVKIWNLNTGELINTLEGHSDEVYSVAFSPDGKMLASSGKDTTIRVWRR